MGASDEVDDEDGIGQDEPAGGSRVDAEPSRDAWDAPADHPHPDQRRDPHDHRRPIGVEAHEDDQAVAYLERQGRVGRGGVAPHPRHLVGELPRQYPRPHQVGIEVVVQQPAMRRIGVGVVAEDRWGDQHGRGDDRQYRPVAQLRLPPGLPPRWAYPEPELKQQRQSHHREDGADPPPLDTCQPQRGHRTGQRRDLGQVGGGQRPQDQQHRSQETEPDRAGIEGIPKRLHRFCQDIFHSCSRSRAAARGRAAGTCVSVQERAPAENLAR